MKNLLDFTYYLFDFDGTLVDSMPSYERVMKRILDENQVPYGEDLITVITPLGTVGTAKYFQSLGLLLSLEEIYDLMKRYLCEEYFYHIPAKEWVAEGLAALKKEGKHLAVLTASPHISLDPCLKRLGLWDCMDHVWSTDDFALSKSDPAIYAAALEKWGAKAEDLIFFDDNPVACETGKKAGVSVAAVFDPTSLQYREQMEAFCDFYLENFHRFLEK